MNLNKPPYPVTSGVKLIGMHGKAGCGKNTAADFICNAYENHYWEAFANPLKEAASKAFSIPLVSFHMEQVKESTDPFWGASPRQIAQFLGTEMFRNCLPKLIPDLGDDFWVKRMQGILNGDLVDDTIQERYQAGDTVVITDVRFQNEYDFITSNGGIIIHLTRDGADGNIGIPDHASESDINLHDNERTYKCDNNGTVWELQEKLSTILLPL